MYKTNSQKAIQNEYHISAHAYCQTHWNDTDDASHSKPSSKCLSSFILMFHLHWKRIHSRQHSATQRCIKQFQTWLWTQRQRLLIISFLGAGFGRFLRDAWSWSKYQKENSKISKVKMKKYNLHGRAWNRSIHGPDWTCFSKSRFD